jgi:phospholipase/carboxylesterase
MMLDPLIIKPNNPTAAIIWLHGLGADGHDFEPIVDRLGFNHIKFILPHAPEMPVTRNNGYVMPAWYDLYGSTGLAKEDEAGIRQTQAYIDSLIQQEIDNGIPSERIAIAGFSQGGAIALQTALRYKSQLAGVLALSTYLPLNASLAAELNQNNQHTPIFMAHGTVDDVIPLTLAQQSHDILKSQALTVDFHAYPMAHSLCEAEINDIQQFLKRILAS